MNVWDPTAFNNYAICLASGNGFTEVVKLLLADARFDPSLAGDSSVRTGQNNRAICTANGHTDVVKLLLADPHVDPSAEKWSCCWQMRV